MLYISKAVQINTSYFHSHVAKMEKFAQFDNYDPLNMGTYFLYLLYIKDQNVVPNLLLK